VCNIVKKFTFAISSHDEFLLPTRRYARAVHAVIVVPSVLGPLFVCLSQVGVLLRWLNLSQKTTTYDSPMTLVF